AAPSSPGATASSSQSGPATAPGDSDGSGASAAPVSIKQAPPSQRLAETGADSSTPLLLAGGTTFVLGGAVFRFGPRVRRTA
ncbi:LPXTG cell wall anchor domain-containing protein, partial [Streptacidiphilus monticola]